jgi:hypothetical protein
MSDPEKGAAVVSDDYELPISLKENRKQRGHRYRRPYRLVEYTTLALACLSCLILLGSLIFPGRCLRRLHRRLLCLHLSKMG